MMKFGLFLDAAETIFLVDMETGEILTRTSDHSVIQQWLSAYEDNYILTLLD